MRRGVTRPEVRVGGFWLSGLVSHWGGLKHSTRTNGDWQASWSVALRHGQRHPALVRGARVEIYLGSICVWAGVLSEPDWESGEMVALGSSREGEQAPALTSGGKSTTKPNTGIDQGIARGVLTWTRIGDFGSTAVGNDDDEGGIYSIRSLLDAWADENLSGWHVGPDRRLVVKVPTETDPAWFVVPGSGELGSADDDRVDRIFVRYQSSTNGRLATTSYPAASVVGGIEQTLDLTDRGRMTSTKATNIAQREWSKLQGRNGWTNGLTLTVGQVTTRGGIPADLALIRAGDAMRLLGVRDDRGLAHNTDVIIGETEYDWDEGSIQLNPVGMAARGETSVLEQVGEIAASAERKAKAVSSLLVTAPHIERSKDAVQNLGTSGTEETVTWPQSVVTGRGGLSHSAGVFTAANAGRYLVTTTVVFASNATGRRVARIVRNSTQVAAQSTTGVAGGVTRVNVSWVGDCAAGDTIDVRAVQASGGALDIDTTSFITITGLIG